MNWEDLLLYFVVFDNKLHIYDCVVEEMIQNLLPSWLSFGFDESSRAIFISTQTAHCVEQELLRLVFSVNTATVFTHLNGAHAHLLH